MRIVDCKTNHMRNPLGFDLDTLTVTWSVTDTKAKFQESAQVIVFLDSERNMILYDSGRKADLSNLGVELPIETKPRTRYYWQVKVWGDNGETAISELFWFETAKKEEAWIGKWIAPNWEYTTIQPYMRKSFHVEKNVKKARVYVTGVGLYELYLNGQKVGKEYLTPGCTTYSEWIQYQTYDVTETIQQGTNLIGSLLGNGWAKGRFGTFGDMNRPSVNQFGLLLEMHIEYEDGSSQIIASDAAWQCHPSPITEDSIYDGEVYDATKALVNWTREDGQQSEWETVTIGKPAGLGVVSERLSLPIIEKEQINPIAILHTPKGETVLDMGQNMTGWIRFKVSEPKYTKIKLSFGEILQDGNFYNKNLRTAKAQYTYISDGQDCVVEPHFTFFGFRFVKLEGFTKQIDIMDFNGCVLYSDIEETGDIQTTDPLLNRLYQNAKWSQKGNFLDVPTDCPQRDERMGWTGDVQVFARTASFNMDTYAFYRKFMKDLWVDQKANNGMVGNVIPSFLSEIPKQMGFSMMIGGTAAWGDCATIVPWEVYQQYGDPMILQEQYKSMRAWVEWIHEKERKSGLPFLWQGGFQFGDWLALDGEKEGEPYGGTDEEYIASAYYAYSAEILSKTAQILGKIEDAIKYKHLSGKIKEAIQREYFSPNGRTTIQTQTAFVLALQMDLVPDTMKKRLLDDFVKILKQNKYHLTTGFVGTPYLCRVLSEHGHSDIAYKILLQEDYPSWLYAVKMGATTIWERWDSVLPDGKISSTGMNSLNHYAYGSIAEWMYRHMCGITPLGQYPGYAHFEIRPELDKNLLGAKASYLSPKGMIKVGWLRQEDGNMTVKVTVPFDATAILLLPYANIESVKGAEGLLCSQDGESVQVTLDAGSYEFRYSCKKDFSNKYSLQNTLAELRGNKETAEAINVAFPGIERIPSELAPADLPLFEILDKNIRQFIGSIVDVDEVIETLTDRLQNVSYPNRNVPMEL